MTEKECIAVLSAIIIPVHSKEVVIPVPSLQNKRMYGIASPVLLQE